MYDFNKNAWHVKLFRWLWGIDPVSHFKTMCPYFWQSLGSIIILPFIILVKLFKVILKPFAMMLDRIQLGRVEKILADLNFKINTAETEEDFFNIYESKCWNKFGWKLRNYDDDDYEEREERFSRIASSWNFTKPKKPNTNPPIDIQKIQDKIVYGWIGKVFGGIIALGLTYLIGWGLYEFVHLFTMDDFLYFMGITLGVVVVGLIIYGIVYLWKYLQEEFWCDSWLSRIRFWTPIWNVIVAIFTFVFYTVIWKGFIMFLDMVKNFYKNQCPTIHWKNE